MQELFEKFFHGLGIEVTSITIIEDGGDISLRLETPDSPLIIGMHGKNLEVFQHLLCRMLEKTVGHFVHLHLEVNDYMKSKDERLFRFLDSKITLVMETGEVTRIANLNAYERKKAHNYIAEQALEGITTKSDGEGIERSIYISYNGVIPSPKTPTLTKKTVPVSPSVIGTNLSEDGVGI